ncbi:MAG: 8-amino-7-oxononanoate synthase [Nitrospirae bacterium GWC2_57_13]|nr:MAG: 8-amino-7-oxononanoate synthase [Nitrospirae bacterium GWC1_57_7]OGW28732.1 MAG: 8-amino-7-oxononanoate synthase [Nitrospirae bacterium GWC2_57_13]
MIPFSRELSDLKQQHLLRHLRTVGSGNGPWITVDGRSVLLLCSNDYLGLAGHQDLQDAARAAMDRYGFGAGASRLVSGSSPLHEELEQTLARFKGTEAALLFNSGYAANTGIIPALASEGDAILSDGLNHASIIDGCRLSRAEVHVYSHGDMNHVESLLKKTARARRRLIVTDGVFSMEGDIAPLPDLCTLAEKYGALLMVDDAHATGVLGDSGRGTAEHFGVSGRVPVQMGTLGKALGSFGAYIAGDRDMITYILNKARSLIFSTALPPAVCAASLAALRVLEQEPWRREQLRKNVHRFVVVLMAQGVDVAASETPIIPIIIGDSEKALLAGQSLMDKGMFALAVRPPTVPEGTARIRMTIMATHSPEDLDRAAAAVGMLKQEGLL